MAPDGQVERLTLPAGGPQPEPPTDTPTTTTLPSEALSYAQTPDEIALLEHFVRTEGVEWTIRHAHLVLVEARHWATCRRIGRNRREARPRRMQRHRVGSRSTGRVSLLTTKREGGTDDSWRVPTRSVVASGRVFNFRPWDVRFRGRGFATR